MTGAPILAVEEVHTGYEDLEIVHGASVTVDRGAIVSIIGPNGAGKSTLLKAIYGLLPVWRGRVRLSLADGDEREISGLRPDERTAAGLNYVPQLDNVFPNMTVRENLEIGAVVAPGAFDERLGQVVDLFPLLGERPRQRAGSLSGGQRQMLALGRALMTDPELLVLDEPSAGLAPAIVDEVLDRLRAINQRGISLLVVEQNARRSLEMSDHAYVLENGRNRLDGPGPELLDDPEVAELYLGGGSRGSSRGGRD